MTDVFSANGAERFSSMFDCNIKYLKKTKNNLNEALRFFLALPDSGSISISSTLHRNPLASRISSNYNGNRYLKLFLIPALARN